MNALQRYFEGAVRGVSIPKGRQSDRSLGALRQPLYKRITLL